VELESHPYWWSSSSAMGGNPGSVSRSIRGRGSDVIFILNERKD